MTESRPLHPDDELAARLAAECFGTALDTRDKGRDKGPDKGPPTRVPDAPDKGRDKGRAGLRQKSATSREEDKRKEGRGKRDTTAALKEAALRDNTRDEPETRVLLAEYEAGELEPARVELGAMPGDASTKAILVAVEIKLAMGLRARVGERRPLPFSTPFACERLGWARNYRKASAAIRELEAAGVVRCVGELPPQRGRGRGTKLYAPPLVAGAGADKSDAIAVKAGGGVEAQPVGELVDEPLVGHAVLVAATGERAPSEVGVADERTIDRLVAARDGAGRGVVDATDGIDATGDPEAERAERIAAPNADLA